MENNEKSFVLFHFQFWSIFSANRLPKWFYIGCKYVDIDRDNRYLKFEFFWQLVRIPKGFQDFTAEFFIGLGYMYMIQDSVHLPAGFPNWV